MQEELNTKPTLFAIGDRVIYTHSTTGARGIGVVMSYNGVHPDKYLQTDWRTALAAEGENLAQYLPPRFLEGEPVYEILFDPPTEQYPFNPYIDNRRIDENPTDVDRGFYDHATHSELMPRLKRTTNIFQNDWARVIGRMWHVLQNSWSNWMVIHEKAYEANKHSESTLSQWQFCVRPLPKPQYRYSPKDGSFYQLSTNPDTGTCHPEGMFPPLGIFVEFNTYSGDIGVKVGMTAQITGMGDNLKCDTVFITIENGKKRVYFHPDVIEWREYIKLSELPAELAPYSDMSKYSFLLSN